jgi:hypothetical protein
MVARHESECRPGFAGIRTKSCLHKNLYTLEVTAKPPKVVFTWINAGKSPAFITHHGVRFLVLPKDSQMPPSDIGTIPEEDYRTPMVVGGTHTRRSFLEQGISHDAWANIASKQSYLIFTAIIRYLDVFGDPHETRYCARFVDFMKKADAVTEFGGEEYNQQT